MREKGILTQKPRVFVGKAFENVSHTLGLLAGGPVATEGFWGLFEPHVVGLAMGVLALLCVRVCTPVCACVRARVCGRGRGQSVLIDGTAVDEAKVCSKKQGFWTPKPLFF